MRGATIKIRTFTVENMALKLIIYEGESNEKLKYLY